ncbi:MAG: hypothetical protein ACYS8Y_11345 [Planctomycetota bacterium]|jgi:hypothetical protein
MAEIENDAQGQKPKISDLAITSAVIPVVLIAVWSFALLLRHFGFFHIWLMPWEDILHNDSYLLIITSFFLAAVILGVFAVVRINKSNGRLGGKGVSIFGIGILFFQNSCPGFDRCHPYNCCLRRRYQNMVISLY